MLYEDHLSDQQILLEVEGELPVHDAKQVRAHLDGCWKCRARHQELQSAITDFIGIHQRELDAELPPAAPSRALLKVRLGQLAPEPSWRSLWAGGMAWALAGVTIVLLTVGVVLTLERRGPSHSRAAVVSVPDSRLTPGAAVLIGRGQVCAEVSANNKAVPVALQRKVFEEYGISGAEPRAYEVDYLITPALGGADDIHNLWPHSYSATVWNAQVKDALENRLREMVCDGSLDLAEAQREIAGNWIAAYKKYFQTDRPLPEHCGRCNQ
ncbi:MAG: hypothetical protein ABSB35_02675 [Bryobacteraceae bacterium]|jgi:hypothetical protein